MSDARTDERVEIAGVRWVDDLGLPWDAREKEATRRAIAALEIAGYTVARLGTLAAQIAAARAGAEVSHHDGLVEMFTEWLAIVEPHAPAVEEAEPRKPLRISEGMMPNIVQPAGTECPTCGGRRRTLDAKPCPDCVAFPPERNAGEES